MSSIGISGPFILFSSLGLLWLTTWVYRVTNDPQDSSTIRKSELRLIQAGKSDSSATKGKLPPLGLLLSKLPAWAIILANVTNNWVSTHYFLMYSFYFSWNFGSALCYDCLDLRYESEEFYKMQGYFVLLSWMPVYFKTVSSKT